MCHSFASSGDSGVGSQGWAIMVITSPQRMVAARRAVAFRHVVRQPRVFKSIKHCEIASVPQLGFTVALQQFPIAFGCERFVNPGWDSPRQCSALLCSLDFIPCVSKDVHLQSPSHRPNNSFKFACSGASQSARSSYVTTARSTGFVLVLRFFTAQSLSFLRCQRNAFVQAQIDVPFLRFLG